MLRPIELNAPRMLAALESVMQRAGDSPHMPSSVIDPPLGRRIGLVGACIIVAVGCSGAKSPGDGADGRGTAGSSSSRAIGGSSGSTSSGGSSAAHSTFENAATQGGNRGTGKVTSSDSNGPIGKGGAAPAQGGSSTGANPSIGGGQTTGDARTVGGSSSHTGGATTNGVGNAGGSAHTSGLTIAGGTKSVGGSAPSGGTASTGGAKSTSATSAVGTGTCAATYNNPVIWEDLPDLEVIRVDDTYYYTASSFHYSPGAPVLRSYDLVHWEFIGHSVPALDFNASYSLSGGRAYVNGIWASSLRYRKSNKTFYWIGCMHGNGGGYVYTATAPEGPWTKHTSQGCYYDVGLLIDDDDKMYVAYGNSTISVALLSADGFSQVKTQQVFTSPADIGALEGSRFYRINGDYYIFTTQYANGEYVLRSTSGPFGPYTLQKFAVKLPFSGTGAGASPHQGGIVQTQNGDWYYMGFNDSYPAGRIPVLAPVTWKDGWPSVTLVNGAWGASYPFPNLPCGAGRVRQLTGTDMFSQATLSHEWEWNHNPDDTKWAAGEGLTLQTATVTSDLYAARNTLTRRIPGPISTATIELDYTEMADGDVAGLAALRDSSAWIGVKKTDGAHKVAMVNNITMDSSWATATKGTEVASASVSGGKLWLRMVANVRTDAGGGHARFFYSTDGSKFVELGNAFTMKKEWQFFLGYRFALFNYATAALGGAVKVSSFQLAMP